MGFMERICERNCSEIACTIGYTFERAHHCHHSWHKLNEVHFFYKINKPEHDKFNKMTCAPSEEDLEQTGSASSLMRVVAVRLMVTK